MCSNVETNLSWACLVSGLLNFEHPSVLLFCFLLNNLQCDSEQFPVSAPTVVNYLPILAKVYPCHGSQVAYKQLCIIVYVVLSALFASGIGLESIGT